MSAKKQHIFVLYSDRYSNSFLILGFFTFNTGMTSHFHLSSCLRASIIGLITCHFLVSLPGQIQISTEDYKIIKQDTLKLTIYQESDALDQPAPAIIFFFGGGWKGGGIGQFRPHAAYLAKRGMVAILADYRTSSKYGTTPFDAVSDAKSAIRYLRKHADALRIDPDRICAAGGSAGGHLAAASATVPGLDDPGDDLNISCRPNALALYNPVFDNGPNGYGYERIGTRYLEISPLHNLSSGVPPTIVFLGTQDPLIPVKTAIAYQERMRAFGNRCDLFLYPDQKHGFFNYKIEKYYRETLYQTDLFLQSLSYLRGPSEIVPEEMVGSEPLTRGHAHNDYRHDRPLVDALQHGFVSVEADILLKNGELFVGHDRHELDSMPSTIKALYLDPLFRRFNHHNGAIFPESKEPFYLWIDIKYEGEQVYDILKEQLEPYREMLAWRQGADLRPGPVMVILSGDRPRQRLLEDSTGFMFLDGRLEDLDDSIDLAYMPFISEHYRKVFDLDEHGDITGVGAESLRKLVKRAHEREKKIRLWATPDTPQVWSRLLDAQVDLINVDDLQGLKKFLKK